MTDIGSLFRRAEIDAEKISALIRLVVLMSLAAATLTAPADRGHGWAVASEAAVAVYGAGTAIGLLLAWRRVFHPAIPYLFVTFDITIVAAQLLLLRGAMGMGSSFAFALPIAGMIFVILIHASMRFRPWLIVYAAGLYLASVEVGMRLTGDDPPMAMGAMGMANSGMGAHPAGMGAVMNYQILPVVLVALATLILFLINRRTRDLLLRSITQANRAARLSRYFSPALAARLADGDDERMLTGRRLPAAVLFIDLRGFTGLGETMAPEELGAFLSEYRARLARPVFAHGGVVDKFIGDAIMAVFGTPEQRPDDARRAVLCALDVIAETVAWADQRAAAGLPPVAVGIGAHYGEVFAGALGDEHLLEYTVIGDTVNVAERLERLSRDVDSALVVSSALLGAVPNPEAIASWRQLPSRELRGHRQPVDAYCLTASADRHTAAI